MSRFDNSLQPNSELPPENDFFRVVQEIQGSAVPEQSEFSSVRQHPRTTRSISVSVQPLNDDFQADGDHFWVVSRDISNKGLGLICHEPISHGYVRIGLMNDLASVIGSVRHITSIGNEYPLFLVGIEFVNDIEEN